MDTGETSTPEDPRTRGGHGTGETVNMRRGRGSPEGRRRRRAWLMKTFGDGKRVPCWWCKRKLKKPEVDRWPICGHDGGTYRRANIVPSCASCNRGRCNVCRKNPQERDLRHCYGPRTRA